MVERMRRCYLQPLQIKNVSTEWEQLFIDDFASILILAEL